MRFSENDRNEWLVPEKNDQHNWVEAANTNKGVSVFYMEVKSTPFIESVLGAVWEDETGWRCNVDGTQTIYTVPTKQEAIQLCQVMIKLLNRENEIPS